MIDFGNYSEGSNPVPAGIHTVELTHAESGTSSKQGTPFVAFHFKVIEDNQYGAGVGQVIDHTCYWTDKTLQVSGGINPAHAALHILNKFMDEQEARTLITSNGENEMMLANAITKVLAERKEKDEKANVGKVKVIQQRWSNNASRVNTLVSSRMPFFQKINEVNKSAMLSFDPITDVEKPLEAGAAVPNTLPPTGNTFQAPGSAVGFGGFAS